MSSKRGNVIFIYDKKKMVMQYELFSNSNDFRKSL